MKRLITLSNSKNLRTGGPQFALIAAVAVLALAITGSAFAAGPKIAKDLVATAAETQVDVIVQFTETPTERHHKLVTDRGGSLKDDLSVVKAGHYLIPASALDDLAQQPEVAYISPNRAVKSLLDVANPTVHANQALAAGYDGTGIGIALIDSGMQHMNDLKNQRLVYSQNFTTDSTTDDLHGHGTHVAGILGGNGFESTGNKSIRSFIGIASNVNIVNLKVLNSTGSGSDRR